MSKSDPLVSVVTPVFNGEKYLVDCIESILAQTYDNLEYTIVNNCSTDRTLEIAQRYAKEDRRIKIVNNSKFVDLIQNHNIAFNLISKGSKYCKLVSADDWIYPECISKLVELAEDNPAVGIVGSYCIRAHGVRFPGLPVGASVFSGRQVCRNFLLGSIDVFGLPTTVLYRSTLVRSSDTFFPTSRPSADIDACLVHLQSCDFGFVHQILAFERIHDEAISTYLWDLNSFFVDRLEFVSDYGHIYLTKSEMNDRLEELSTLYYNFLAECYLKVWEPKFWTYHKQRMAKIGYSFYSVRLGKAVLRKIGDLLLNPKQTSEKVVKRMVFARPRGKRPWVP